MTKRAAPTALPMATASGAVHWVRRAWGSRTAPLLKVAKLLCMVAIVWSLQNEGMRYNTPWGTHLPTSVNFFLAENHTAKGPNIWGGCQVFWPQTHIPPGMGSHQKLPTRRHRRGQSHQGHGSQGSCAPRHWRMVKSTARGTEKKTHNCTWS